MLRDTGFRKLASSSLGVADPHFLDPQVIGHALVATLMASAAVAPAEPERSFSPMM